LLSPGVGLGITFMGMVLLGLFTPIDKLTIPAIRANLETLLLSGDPPTLAQALCVLSTGVITSEQEKQLKLKLVSVLQGINPESVPILTDREKAVFDALLLSRNSNLVFAAKAVAPYFSQKDAARRELLRGSHKGLTPELLHPSQEIKPDVRELLHPSDEKDEETEDNSD
ncbi:MAG: hypothetical protein H7308_10715, partial [Chthonomonadaceae bacterium]|nr:hypothetical protein [Chthonomonadaceae bacterium]